MFCFKSVLIHKCYLRRDPFLLLRLRSIESFDRDMEISLLSPFRIPLVYIRLSVRLDILYNNGVVIDLSTCLALLL